MEGRRSVVARRGQDRIRLASASYNTCRYEWICLAR